VKRIAKDRWQKGQLIRAKWSMELDEINLTFNQIYIVEDPPFMFEKDWMVGVVNDKGEMAAYMLHRFAQADQTSDAGRDEYDEIMEAQSAFEDVR
jgi:hypothetical protein